MAGTGGGFGFIDFDKIMHAPPTFDLAKLLATGFFQINAETGSVRFQRSRAMGLLAGYRSVRSLTPAELAAIEGFAVMLSEEIARLGHQYAVDRYHQQAGAVGGWWLARRRRHLRDPLGIRTGDTTKPQESGAAEQLPFVPGV